MGNRPVQPSGVGHLGVFHELGSHGVQLVHLIARLLEKMPPDYENSIELRRRNDDLVAVGNTVDLRKQQFFESRLHQIIHLQINNTFYSHFNNQNLISNPYNLIIICPSQNIYHQLSVPGYYWNEIIDTSEKVSNVIALSRFT